MEEDPDKPLEDSLEAVAARHRKTYMMLGAVVGAMLLLLAAYHFMTLPKPLPASGEDLSASDLAQAVKPWIGRLEFTGVSGKPQPVGLAVTIGEGEMVTTCHNLPRGSGSLVVVFFDAPSKAEPARFNKQSDICPLRVTTTGPTAAKLRGSDPATGEKVYVVTMADPAAPPKLVQTRVTNPVSDPGGTGFGLESKEAFPTGAAVFDTQGRLAGIVNSPHNLGDFAMVYGATRIASARK